MNEPSNCLILIKFGRAVHFGLVIKAENKHRTRVNAALIATVSSFGR